MKLDLVELPRVCAVDYRTRNFISSCDRITTPRSHGLADSLARGFERVRRACPLARCDLCVRGSWSAMYICASPSVLFSSRPSPLPIGWTSFSSFPFPRLPDSFPSSLLPRLGCRPPYPSRLKKTGYPLVLPPCVFCPFDSFTPSIYTLFSGILSATYDPLRAAAIQYSIISIPNAACPDLLRPFPHLASPPVSHLASSII